MKKLLEVIGISGLLLAMSSFPAMAANYGWEQINNGKDWIWRGRDGYIVYDTWKTGADGTWYYLGDDGIMDVNCLIEDDGDYYYVDELGRMVKNQWRKLYSEDYGEEYWYYFRDNGKAYKGTGDKVSLKTIGDRKYIFDDEGRMQWGWVLESGNMIDEDDTEGWKEAVYYCGSENEGWVSTGWKQIEVDYEDDSDDGYYLKDRWFYFGNSGKKTVDKDLRLKNADGKEYRYGFDKYGVMLSQTLVNVVTVNADGTTSTTTKYYDSKGTLNKAKWIERVPSRSQNADDYNNDIKRKFYSQKNGNLVKDEIRKINNKWYCFDSAGIMRVGLVAVKDGKYAYTLQNTNEYDDIWADASDLVKAKNDGYTIMLFDEKTGARKTGKVTVELNDDKYTMRFLNSGEAADGEYQGYLYEAGILLKADRDRDEKYQEFTVNGVVYKVDRNGRIQK